MAKKQPEEKVNIPIIGSISGEVEKQDKLKEFIEKDTGLKEFEIYSVKPIENEPDQVSVYVYFDNRTWARRYTLNKSIMDAK